MSRPTTVRLPDALARELERAARAHGLERGTYLRQLIREGLGREREAGIRARYEAGELSLTDAATRLGMDPVSFVDELRRLGRWLNVSLEDWRDSASLRGSRSTRRKRPARILDDE